MENEKAKNVRRAAKGNLTRMLNAGNQLLETKRQLQEVRDAFQKVKAAHTDLVAKHEAYTMFLNDEEYTEAETWMDDCTRNYIEFSMLVNDYTNDTDDPSPQIQDEENEDEENGVEVEVQNVISGEHENEGNASAKTAEASAKPVVLKHDKPKLPTFYGDVRKYLIFREDFKHAVEKRCNARDTIAILRSCLGPEPAKLIKGISSDLKAAWRYLDQNYGDPRVISDTVTADMERFKPI